MVHFFVNGRPLTIASDAGGLSGCVLVAKPSAFNSVMIAVFIILIILNIYSWDYQNRHGWADEDDTD